MGLSNASDDDSWSTAVLSSVTSHVDQGLTPECPGIRKNPVSHSGAKVYIGQFTKNVDVICVNLYWVKQKNVA